MQSASVATASKKKASRTSLPFPSEAKWVGGSGDPRGSAGPRIIQPRYPQLMPLRLHMGYPGHLQAKVSLSGACVTAEAETKNKEYGKKQRARYQISACCRHACEARTLHQLGKGMLR